MARETPEDFWKRLDETPEDTVRLNIRAKRYGAPKLQWAEEWLRRRDVAKTLESEERSNASQAEQTLISRSATDAAWEAATAAREANELAREANTLAIKANTTASNANSIALAAIVTAIIAILFSIIDFFF